MHTSKTHKEDTIISIPSISTWRLSSSVIQKKAITIIDLGISTLIHMAGFAQRKQSGYSPHMTALLFLLKLPLLTMQIICTPKRFKRYPKWCCHMCSRCPEWSPWVPRHCLSWPGSECILSYSTAFYMIVLLRIPVQVRVHSCTSP